MAQHVVAEGNFLVPNATFIAELVAFVLILLIVRKYIVPPVQKAMRERQDIIEQQVADAEETKVQLAKATEAYQNALSEARSEAASIREGARAEAQRTIEELRASAQEEAARIIARGDEQLENQRNAIVRELRSEIGTLAVELSEKIVDQRLSDESQVQATVDAFLAGLEARDTAAETSGGHST